MLFIKHVYTPKFWSSFNYKVVSYINSENCWETQKLEATAIIIHRVGRRLGKSDRRTTHASFTDHENRVGSYFTCKESVGSNRFVPHNLHKITTRWAPPKWFGRATAIIWLMAVSMPTLTSLSFNHNYSTLIEHYSDNIIVAAVLYRLVGQGVKLTFVKKTWIL